VKVVADLFMQTSIRMGIRRKFKKYRQPLVSSEKVAEVRARFGRPGVSGRKRKHPADDSDDVPLLKKSNTEVHICDVIIQLQHEMAKARDVSFVHRELITSLIKVMLNHPKKGVCMAHVTIFACANLDLQKFDDGMLLTDVNDAINDRPLLLAPMALDTNDAIHYDSSSGLICVCDANLLV